VSDSWRAPQSRVARLARAQKSMIPGSVDGRVAQARTVRARPRNDGGGSDEVEALFSYPYKPVAGEESPPYYVRLGAAETGTVIAATTSSPTATTTISVLVNGSVVGSVSIPGGTKAGETVIEATLAYGDLISVKCSAVAADISGLTVQVLMGE